MPSILRFTPRLRRLCLGLIATIICFSNPNDSGLASAQSKYQAPADAYQKGDFATAFTLWIRLAEEGNRGAYYNLGNLYLKGRGVRLNLLEAYKWFLLADRAGLPQAKIALRRMNKVMTPADKKEANLRVLRWYDLHPKTKR
jgi:uncharacterized protein